MTYNQIDPLNSVYRTHVSVYFPSNLWQMFLRYRNPYGSTHSLKPSGNPSVLQILAKIQFRNRAATIVFIKFFNAPELYIWWKFYALLEASIFWCVSKNGSLEATTPSPSLVSSI